MLKKIFLLIVFCGLINHLPAADFYWVGGSGNWSDFGNHWATTSNGTTFQSHAPFSGDNVFFDSNSFTTSHDTITADQTTIYCNNMTWSNASSHPVFRANGSTAFNIYGSFILTPTVAFIYNGSINFQSSVSGNMINCAGVILQSTVIFDSPTGEWGLQDSLNTTGTLNLIDGIFRTNNVKVSAVSFTESGNHSASVYLGTSTITLQTHWTISDSSTVVDADSAVIILGGTFSSNGPVHRYNYFKIDGPVNTMTVTNGNIRTFSGSSTSVTSNNRNVFIDSLFTAQSFALNGIAGNTINYLLVNGNFSMNANSANDTVRTLLCGGNAAIFNPGHTNVFGKAVINGLFTINNSKNKFRFASLGGNGIFSSNDNSFDTLMLTPSRTYTFAANDTQRVNNWFGAWGTPSQPIYLSSSVAWSQASLTIGQTNLCLDNLIVQDMNGIGANLNLGANTNNVSNNSGWQFSSCTSICNAPSAPAVTGNDTGCYYLNNNYQVQNPVTGENYYWIINHGYIISGQGTSMVQVLWTQTGNCSLQVISSNNCGQNISSVFPVAVIQAPHQPIIYGAGAHVCQFSTDDFFSYSLQPAGCSYSWSVTGGIITSGQDSTDVTVYWTAPDSGSLSVTVSNQCATVSFTQSFIVVPAPVISSSGNVNICFPGVLIDTILNPCAGCDYKWYPGAYDTLIETFSNQGTKYISWFSPQCGSWNNTDTFQLYINSGPTFPLLSSPGVSNICVGQGSLVEAVINPCPTCIYSWSDGHTGQSDTFSVTTTFHVISSNACGPSVQGDPAQLIIDTIPVSPHLSTEGTVSECPGQFFNDTITNPCSGCLYSWTDGGNGMIRTLTTPQQYYVWTVNACGFSSYGDSVHLFIYPALNPSISLAGNTLTCNLSGVNYQWYFNSAPMSGVTSQIIPVLQTGVYYVIVTDTDGCTFVSNNIYCVPTGVNDPAIFPAIAVFPDPSDGNFEINVPDQTSEVRIYNSLGQLVNRFVSFNQTDFKINLQSEGIYTAVIYTPEGTFSKRIIVKN